MITRDLVTPHRPDLPYNYAIYTRAAGEEFLKHREHQPGWELLKVHACACCGEATSPPNDGLNPRCARHADRNPCIIEGCRKTIAAKSALSSDVMMCGDHWRRYVPKGSRARAAYLALRRRGKNDGWSDETWRKFNQLWDTIVRRARRQSTEGRVDVAEIHKLFGWEDAA